MRPHTDLALPNPAGCIAIYGSRGVGKSSIALQLKQIKQRLDGKSGPLWRQPTHHETRRKLEDTYHEAIGGSPAREVLLKG